MAYTFMFWYFYFDFVLAAIKFGEINSVTHLEVLRSSITEIIFLVNLAYIVNKHR